METVKNLPYKRTQIACSMIAMIAIAIVIASFLKAFIVVAVLCGTALLFLTLTVAVDAENVTVWFGPGFFKKALPAIDVESCRMVKHCFWPWGFWGWPGKAWFFSVAGTHSVEIKMRDGVRYMIGTNRPEDLEKAVHEAMRESVHLATKVG
jgi:hypothetical protein